MPPTHIPAPANPPFKTNLIYTVIMDAPGAEGYRFLGKMLVSSLLRTFFTGDIVVFRNCENPLFLVERKGTIEHQKGWFHRIKRRLSGNEVVLLLRPPLWQQGGPYDAALPGQFAEYIEAWREFGDSFDTVLIDGRARVDAALSVAAGLRPGALLFFHDFFRRERYWKRLPELERFYNLVDSVKDTEQTLAIFERR